MRPEHEAIRRIEDIARLSFDKKLEDLEEHELREVYQMEAILAQEGRADPLRHARAPGAAGVRGSAS